MAAVQIMVRWRAGIEVITVDLAALRGGAEIRETAETWSGSHYHYETRSSFVPDAAGGGVLTLHYDPASNRHLPKELECRWGYSVFFLDAALQEGAVVWLDDDEPFDDERAPAFSGSWHWQRLTLEAGELRQREEEAVLRKARKQAQFRKRLMMIDPKCALTGEREAALLEAAHVRSVASNGSDAARNGLMLRVDLHRLFDAGFFSIEPTGMIKVRKPLPSSAYDELLRERFIGGATLDRVRAALGKRPAVRSGGGGR